MNIRDRINDGAYENKVPYPERSGDMEGRAAKMAEYNRGQRAAEAKFKADLEREFDVAGHTKAGKLFDLAWREGHSSGYSEVLNYYEEFVELLK